MHFGYATVHPQMNDRFLEAGMFLDMAGDTGVPAFHRLLDRVQEGDCVVIPSLTALGTCRTEILEKLDLFKDRGVKVIVLDLCQGFDSAFLESGEFRPADVNLPEEERNSLQYVLPELKGLRPGRKPKRKPLEFHELYKAYAAGRISSRQAANRLHVSHTTFLKWAKQMKD